MPFQTDNYALIVSPDGGDTLAREADLAMLMPPDMVMEPVWQLLECGWGLWRRHPTFNSNCTSRDQLLPLIVALGFRKEYGRLFRLLLRTTLRLGFAQDWHDLNGKWQVGDPMQLFYGVFIRAFGLWALPFWPILLVLDLNLLIGTLWDIRPWRATDDVDDTNSITQHLQATHMPTPFSWLAGRLYAKLRPMNLGNTVNGERSPVMGAVSYYFNNPGFNGNKDFIELYRPEVERWLT